VRLSGSRFRGLGWEVPNRGACSRIVDRFYIVGVFHVGLHILAPSLNITLVKIFFDQDIPEMIADAVLGLIRKR